MKKIVLIFGIIALVLINGCVQDGGELERCMLECIKTKSEQECKVECGAPDVGGVIPPLEKTKQIEVSLDSEEGNVRNFLGVLDPPISPIKIENRIDPGRKYKEIGIKYAVIGQSTAMGTGSLSKYILLDTLFLDNSKDANDKSNYDFTLLDKAVESCLENDITPMLQLLFAINCYEECGKEPDVKAEGYVPEDYEKWVAVATNVVKHFNGLFDVPNQSRSFSAGDVKHFIVWDEPSDWHIPPGGTFQYDLPLWTGDFNDFWELYETFVNKIETDPEMASIKDIIKIGGPSADYNYNDEFVFVNKIIETKTRLDFISEDFYSQHFWQFVNDPISGGIKGWNDQYNKIKNSDKKYSELEWHLNAFNFQSIPHWQGYCDPNDPFCYPNVNFESHYGAALLASYLIYAEGTELSSFIWHGGQGDYGDTPLVPLAFGTLFSGKAKFMYAGLTFKMSSKMLSFDGEPAIKVASKGEELNYSEEVREEAVNQLVGYKKQDVIQVLSAKSEDKTKIRVLISNWNINPEESRYDSYNIKIKNALNGNYSYKIFVIDKSHTFSDRCDECPTWNIGDKSEYPEEVQEKTTELEGRCDEFKSVYCPEGDKSIRKEGELGIAEEGTASSSNNEINLQVTGVTSSAVHLVELSKII